MATVERRFCVDLESPIAVYVQIENLVRFEIASGRVGPGETLPSVRDMSNMLGVNPNTVTKAYRDLELLGMVNTRRGVGVTVADQAPKLCRAATWAMVRNHLRDAVAECLAAGIAESEIRDIVSATLQECPPPYSGPGVP